MKYVKMLGLAAVAAMALMAFLGASSASATVLCTTTTTPCGSGWVETGTLTTSLEGSATLESTGGGIEDTCTESSVSGNITNSGSETETVVGSVSSLSFGNCTQTTVVTEQTGTLELHHIAGTDNGTVTAKGFEVTILLVGVTCTFGAGEGTDLGTFTGGKPGTMDIHAVVKKVTGGFLCPSDSIWDAKYVVTTPGPNATLHVEPQ